MSQPAIKVEGLCKEYVIGAHSKDENFREMLVNSLAAPFKRFMRGQVQVEQEERFWALRDVSFDIQSGEVVGIIGRNGAGKSTLLKILSRITQPTHGKVEIRGRVSSLLEVGTGFHPELTGRENTFLNGSILGMKRHEVQSKFDEIVAFAEVERFIDTPIKHYSSGMQVRLAFAVAAHLDPEILIVDEVLAVGDAAFQKKSLGKMEGFANQGRTVIFVSHHMSVVRGLCQRCLVLEQGSLVHLGDVATGVNSYLKSTSGEKPKTLNTKTLPRPREIAPDTPAQITCVTIDIDRPQAILLSGEDIKIVFELKVSELITDIVLGWALWRDGLLVFETRNVDSYGPIQNLEPGHYRFISRVNNISISPGSYTISVGLRDNTQSLDYLPNVLTIEIESARAMSSRWFEEKYGLISVQGQWSDPQSC